ncbi:MAG: cation:proton antiporter [Elusimicrobia bacterium]|nr:cation:proton antiporter [Elusimicrobiota bacterium]
MELVIIGIGVLTFLAHLFAALFEKTRVPDVVPLVLLGLAVGPVFGLVGPAAFGKIGGVFTTLALVIILFQGGLGLNFAALRDSVGQGSRLTFVNFILSAAVVGPLAHALLGLGWLESFMAGSIVGGTSSAVVIPMVAKLRLQERTRTALFLESAFSDVLCIIVTLALLQSVRSNELRPGIMAGQIISSFTMASVIGSVGAVFWSNILARVRELENSLFMTPAFVCIVFGLAELLGFSGAIAALAFGIVLGNVDTLARLKMPGPLFSRLKPVELNKTEEALFAEIVFLLKTFFFVYIGLSMQFTHMYTVLAGLGLTAALFLTRVAVVRWSLSPSTSRSDASLAAVMTPKGLAAAVLAAMPLQAGVASGAVIQDMVYAVVLFSIGATTLLTFLLERGSISKPYAAALSNFAPDEGVLEVRLEGR